MILWSKLHQLVRKNTRHGTMDKQVSFTDARIIELMAELGIYLMELIHLG